MPFWKKMFSKKQEVYYPRAVVQGKPVETETIAKDLARISTVSNSDVQAVLGDIAPVMYTRMAQGKSVRIKFIPERTKFSNATYTRVLVDSDELEWIELSPEIRTPRPAARMTVTGIWKRIRRGESCD